MITEHVWRPSTVGGGESRPYAERPCVYFGCDQPLSEHVQPVADGGLCPCPVYDQEPGDEVCVCGHYLHRHEGLAGACKAVVP